MRNFWLLCALGACLMATACSTDPSRDDLKSPCVSIDHINSPCIRKTPIENAFV